MIGSSSGALTLLAWLSLAGHLRAETRGPRWQIYLFKPTTTGLLLAVALLAPGPAGSRYQTAVVAGLMLSLVGDIWLMLPQDRFVPGLLSFLLAHLAYLVALTSGLSPVSAPGLVLPPLVFALVLLRRIWPVPAPLGAPVLAYTAVLVVMTWRALARARLLGTPGATLAAVGAGLFLLSDGALALRRFRGTFRYDQGVIMSTYVAAQSLIAWSTAYP
jgi:uncharacterized membrane protein YhhN